MKKEVDIERVIEITQLLKKTIFTYLEQTIEDIKSGTIKNPELIEDLKKHGIIKEHENDELYLDF